MSRENAPRQVMNRERFGTVDDRIEQITDALRIRFCGSARVVDLAYATGLPATVVGSAMGEMVKRGLVHRDGAMWIDGP